MNLFLIFNEIFWEKITEYLCLLIFNYNTKFNFTSLQANMRNKKPSLSIKDALQCFNNLEDSDLEDVNLEDSDDEWQPPNSNANQLSDVFELVSDDEMEENSDDEDESTTAKILPDSACNLKRITSTQQYLIHG